MPTGTSPTPTAVVSASPMVASGASNCVTIELSIAVSTDESESFVQADARAGPRMRTPISAATMQRTRMFMELPL